MDEYTWYLEHDLHEYAGKWVAIKGAGVVAADEDFKQMVKDLDAQGIKLSDVFFARIPETDVALVYAQC